MELPLRAGTNSRTALSGSEGLELNSADCGDERSDYELQRARSIRHNKEFLHSQQMLMLFWLPKSDGVGVMLQNQALFQWYQQLMMLGFQGQRRTVR
ncbi:hypothetical protein EMCRGX_G015222 [Ephydatia muelleri]